MLEDNPYSSPETGPSFERVPVPFDSQLQQLVAELDEGLSPTGVLVVREARWQRFIASCLGLLVGITAGGAGTTVAWHFGDIYSAVLFFCFAAAALSGSIWLLGELLNANYFYAALDDKYFYHRQGPRKLLVIPLDELDLFEVRFGTLTVCHRQTGRRITVVKNAYASENIDASARRMNTWREMPPVVRPRCQPALDLAEAQILRDTGHRQISRGLNILCFLPLVVVLCLVYSFARPLSIVLWGGFVVTALLSAIAGIVRWVTATRRIRRILDSISSP